LGRYAERVPDDRDEPLKIDLDPGTAIRALSQVEPDDRCPECGGVGYHPEPQGIEPPWHICQGCAGTGKVARSKNTPVRPRPTVRP
jgi:DnaJ-class molecular chaperone